MSVGRAKSRCAAVAVALAVIAAGVAPSVGATASPTAASKCVSRGGLPDPGRIALIGEITCGDSTGALGRRAPSSQP